MFPNDYENVRQLLGSNLFHVGALSVHTRVFPFTEQAIHLGSCIDNINVDVQTGDLWLAGSPNVLRAVQHFQNVSLPAPAQVISIRLNQYQPSAAVPFPDYEAREVYLNDGSELKTSSAAVVFNGTLVIGSVDGNVLLCDVKAY